MADTFDVNNFIIDRILRGVMTNKNDYEALWSLNQITNPTLSVTTEKDEVVDALGAKIAEFERAKNAEFSAENALFDLALFAAQSGTEKIVASSSETITVPMFEEIDVSSSTQTVTLSHTPTEQITAIYLLNDNSTLGTKYTNGTSSTSTTFVNEAGSSTLTLPSGLGECTIFVMYEYEASSAVAVHDNAEDFPTAGRFIMEVLGADVCDPGTKIHAYIIFPNAKLQGDVDITFSSDSTHGFTIEAMNDYCSRNRRLLSIIIPDED